MNSELRPTEHLEELFHGANAPGHGNKPVRQFRHHRLALVHGTDNAQIRKPAVGNLSADQRVRNDSGHMPPELQHRICHHVHQPNVSASVDEPIAAIDKRPAKRSSRIGILGAGAMPRSRKYTDPSLQSYSDLIPTRGTNRQPTTDRRPPLASGLWLFGVC